MTNPYIVRAAVTVVLAAAVAGCGGYSTTTNPNPLAGKPTNGFIFAQGSATLAPVDLPNGPADGDVTVTLTGTGSLSGAVTVYFGETPAGSALRLPNTSTGQIQINAVTPPGVGGDTVDVRVVDSNGVSAITPNDQYTYIPAPPAPPPTTTGATTGPPPAP